jgi:phosphoribosyl-ATP pyrophosphohydrolase
MVMHPPLSPAATLNAALERLAATIDARALNADPASSWTAKLLARGPPQCAKKFGEEAVEFSLAVAAQGEAEVASEAADVLYHLAVALRSRGVSLDAVAAALTAREGTSGIDEKASRPKG